MCFRTRVRPEIERDALVSRFLIVCEGRGDGEFFARLLATREIEGFDVDCALVRDEDQRVHGGKDAFEDYLRLFKIMAKKDQLPTEGILLAYDNDNDCDKAFAYIQKQIETVGQFGIPEKPREWAESGERLPRIMALPIPWSDQKGELETLVSPSAISAMGNTSPCIERFLTCGEETHNCALPKTRLRILIAAAWPRDPNVALGTIFKSRKTRHLIPTDHSCLDQISNFLSTLVVPGG